MKYTPVVGLEVHIQPKTKTKMFSSVSAEYFGKAPNTNVDPVSLGLPGALPVPNQKAIELCILLSLALGCKINQHTKFDRKNYFYPDLPKGYQISQYDLPIGYAGELSLNLAAGEKTIGITRVHMEEDTGKSINEGGVTLVDFNKAGVPLIEVVTEPVFETGEQIDVFAKRLRQIVRYLGVSDGDMEKGQMRYELNISLRKSGETGLPNYKVEVKNIGSISLLQKVLEFEIDRQTQILDSGAVPVQETRGTRDMTGKTHSQRLKEDSDDYRYFPEPDIPPIYFETDYLEKLKASLPQLPNQLYSMLVSTGLKPENAETIIAELERANLMQEFLKSSAGDAESVEFGKLIIGELIQVAEQQNISLREALGNIDLVRLCISAKVSGQINSTVYKQLLAGISQKTLTDESQVRAAITKASTETSSNTDAYRQLLEAEIALEPDARAKFAKNPNLAMFFVGQVMKKLQGKADASVLRKIAEELLR